MTENDFIYIKSLLDTHLISGDVLELGGGYGGMTSRKLVVEHGLDYYSTDIEPSANVDYIVDMSNSIDVKNIFSERKFGTVLVLNVIEHVFEPLNVLDCSLSLVEEGGTLVVIAPALWTIHNYPNDFYRFLPDWFEYYATSRNLKLLRQSFKFLGYGQVDEFKNKSGQYCYPFPVQPKSFNYYKSKIVHKLFNTFGRGMSFPSHLAIGLVYRKLRY